MADEHAKDSKDVSENSTALPSHREHFAYDPAGGSQWRPSTGPRYPSSVIVECPRGGRMEQVANGDGGEAAGHGRVWREGEALEAFGKAVEVGVGGEAHHNWLKVGWAYLRVETSGVFVCARICGRLPLLLLLCKTSTPEAPSGAHADAGLEHGLSVSLSCPIASIRLHP